MDTIPPQLLTNIITQYTSPKSTNTVRSVNRKMNTVANRAQEKIKRDFIRKGDIQDFLKYSVFTRTRIDLPFIEQFLQSEHLDIPSHVVVYHVLSAPNKPGAMIRYKNLFQHLANLWMPQHQDIMEDLFFRIVNNNLSKIPFADYEHMINVFNRRDDVTTYLLLRLIGNDLVYMKKNAKFGMQLLTSNIQKDSKEYRILSHFLHVLVKSHAIRNMKDLFFQIVDNNLSNISLVDYKDMISIFDKREDITVYLLLELLYNDPTFLKKNTNMSLQLLASNVPTTSKEYKYIASRIINNTINSRRSHFRQSPSPAAHQKKGKAT